MRPLCLNESHELQLRIQISHVILRYRHGTAQAPAGHGHGHGTGTVPVITQNLSLILTYHGTHTLESCRSVALFKNGGGFAEPSQ